MSETNPQDPGHAGGPESTGSTPSLQEQAVTALMTIYDPEIPVDIYQLGLIYEVLIQEPGDRMLVTMTLTSPTCPAAGVLPGEVQAKLQKLEGIKEVKVELTWDPPWNPEMMSEAAKLTLGV